MKHLITIIACLFCLQSFGQGNAPVKMNAYAYKADRLFADSAMGMPINSTTVMSVTTLVPGLFQLVFGTDTSMYVSFGVSNSRIIKMIDSIFLYRTFATSLTTQYLKVGGNTQGGPLIFGTNDNQLVQVKQNGTVVWQWNSTGIGFGGGMANFTSVNNAFYNASVSGAIITRNVADGNAILTVKNQNLSSTGLLTQWQDANGVNKFTVNNIGNLVAQGSVTASSFAIASGTANQILLGNGATAVYLSTTSTIDFGSVAANSVLSAPSTVALTGAIVGDAVNVSQTADSVIFTATCTATGVITVREFNPTLLAKDPASQTFKFTILR